MDEKRQKIVEGAIAAERAQHAELLDAWKSLDAKGLAVITAAGVFMAAVVAFSTKSSGITWKFGTSFSCSLALLIIAVGFSARSLFLRKTPVLACAAEIDQTASDTLGLANDRFDTAYPKVLSTHLLIYKNATVLFKVEMDKKKRDVVCAFMAFASGVYFSVITFIIFIITTAKNE